MQEAIYQFSCHLTQKHRHFAIIRHFYFRWLIMSRCPSWKVIRNQQFLSTNIICWALPTIWWSVMIASMKWVIVNGRLFMKFLKIPNVQAQRTWLVWVESLGLTRSMCMKWRMRRFKWCYEEIRFKNDMCVFYRFSIDKRNLIFGYSQLYDTAEEKDFCY